MDEKNRDFKHSEGTEVTLPISDTVPGPGNYTVRVLNMNGGTKIPVVNATDLIDSTGAGTAADKASALQAPEPGLDRVGNTENENDRNG